jgi:hypothetical protein
MEKENKLEQMREGTVPPRIPVPEEMKGMVPPLLAVPEPDKVPPTKQPEQVTVITTIITTTPTTTTQEQNK